MQQRGSLQHAQQPILKSAQPLSQACRLDLHPSSRHPIAPRPRLTGPTEVDAPPRPWTASIKLPLNPKGQGRISHRHRSRLNGTRTHSPSSSALVESTVTPSASRRIHLAVFGTPSAGPTLANPEGLELRVAPPLGRPAIYPTPPPAVPSRSLLVVILSQDFRPSFSYGNAVTPIRSLIPNRGSGIPLSPRCSFPLVGNNSLAPTSHP